MKVLKVNIWYYPNEDAKYLKIVCDNVTLYKPVEKVLADLRKANRDINRLMFIKPDIDVTLLCRLMLHYSEITTHGEHIKSIKVSGTANRILARSLKR